MKKRIRISAATTHTLDIVRYPDVARDHHYNVHVTTNGRETRALCSGKAKNLFSSFYSQERLRPSDLSPRPTRARVLVFPCLKVRGLSRPQAGMLVQ